MYLIFIIFHRPKEILYCFLLLIVWFYWSLSLSWMKSLVEKLFCWREVLWGGEVVVLWGVSGLFGPQSEQFVKSL